jgi:hypothetical protein
MKSNPEREAARGEQPCLLPLREELVGRGLGLLGALLLHLLVDAPLVAEGIDDLSLTRPPEHVLYGHEYPGARRDRTLHNLVGIVHLQRDAHARSTKRVR